jgi:UDPglucose 6-dehydrogenase
VSNITIVGAGHVGVVYAAGFAELGHHIRVVDIEPRRIRGLSRGQIWFYEPGLPELLERGLRRRRITFTTSYATGLRDAHFVFVCVPTPSGADGSLDDTYLKKAFAEIRATASQPWPIVLNKSTVPVGTGDLATSIFEGSGIAVVSNPEFLAEGRAVEDFFHPARVVIGTRDRAAAEAVQALYAPLRAPMLVTDPVTAELSKLASNGFLATKVSFANVLSRIAEGIGADGEALAKALALDPRIGAGHLRAGLGYGGSCLPKDLAAIEQLANRFAGSSDLFGAVQGVNREQRGRVIAALLQRFGSLKGRRIGMLGLSFKPNTDDVRESPALMLAQDLGKAGAAVFAYDPVVGKKLPPALSASFTIKTTAMAAIRGAEAVVVATDWPEFGALDLAVVRKAMRGTFLVDGRGIIDGRAARRLGFEIFSFSAAPESPVRLVKAAGRASSAA